MKDNSTQAEKPIYLIWAFSIFALSILISLFCGGLHCINIEELIDMIDFGTLMMVAKMKTKVDY